VFEIHSGNTSQSQMWQWIHRGCWSFRKWKWWHRQWKDNKKEWKPFPELALNVICHYLLCLLTSWYGLSRGMILNVVKMSYASAFIYAVPILLFVHLFLTQEHASITFFRFSPYGQWVLKSSGVWTLPLMMLVTFFQYQVTDFLPNNCQFCTLWISTDLINTVPLESWTTLNLWLNMFGLITLLVHVFIQKS